MKKGFMGIAIFIFCLSLSGCGKGEAKLKEEKHKDVYLRTLENGHYELIVKEKPFVIKGICYAPVPIGKSHLFNFTCDPNKPWMVDGKLMNEMGVNTVRLYQPGDELAACKEMIEDLYKNYGIYTVMGHSLGFWEYHVNELAKKIKEIDPNHPVSLGNGETVGMEFAADICPDVDLLGCIVYRGKVFGSFFKEVKRKFDKPVMITEFGCDAYNAFAQKEDQLNQAKFLKSQWLDLEKHLANGEGLGNCVGGIIFEWNDEWWKTSDCDRDSWLVHDTEASWGVGAYAFDAQAGKNMNEEWFGVVAFSPELENNLNKRMPRKAYYELRELWNKDFWKQDEESSAEKKGN
ncbi:MAG: hypothetical protein HY810_06885 [Candidatus Omnitrophica bacterium]|nr:hypothetical protein [Candidatus Omnitrophota bacterium]